MSEMKKCCVRGCEHVVFSGDVCSGCFEILESEGIPKKQDYAQEVFEEEGGFKGVIYPTFYPDGDIRWAVHITVHDMTLIHVCGKESRKEIKEIALNLLKQLSAKLLIVGNRLLPKGN